jgi:propionyl-CoA carboxylase alpha chain
VLTITGHAIEARLYAEDPAAGFLPATGTLLDWCPAAEPECRWDSGVETGSVIGPEFDPMLAKVIAHALTRPEAALRLALALRRSRVRGVTTNRDFLTAALRHPEFLAGRTTTDFIERAGVPLARKPSPAELRTAAVAAALAGQARARAGAGVLATLPSGWRNSVMPPQRAGYRHAGATLTVSYRSRRDGGFEVEVAAEGPGAGGPVLVTVHRAGDGWIDFSEGGLRHRRHVLRDGSRVWVQGPDGDVLLTALPRFPEAEADAVAGGLLAPMPGSVLAVHVSPGDSVRAGQLLMIVEAMKMEHRITAPHAGTVGEVRAHPGDQVTGGDLLAVIEPAGDGGRGERAEGDRAGGEPSEGAAP